MRIRKQCATLALLLTAALLTGCSGNETQNSTTEPVTETQMATTEPETAPEFTVEPNAIEGLSSVEQMVPLGSGFLMVGLNEHDGRSVALYQPETGEVTPKLLHHVTETTDVVAFVPDESGNLYIFYSDNYVELYDSSMALLEEQEALDMVGEEVDFASMQIDKEGNRYFFVWDTAGNHEIWVFDKEMQLLGTMRGEMTVGDELFSAADGKVYVRYHVGANTVRFALVDPASLSIQDIAGADMPAYHKFVVAGENGYDFYLNAQEALYGIHAAEGSSDVKIDWLSTVFDGNEILALAALPDGSYLVSNAGGNEMDPGVWKMVVKESTISES